MSINELCVFILAVWFCSGTGEPFSVKSHSVSVHHTAPTWTRERLRGRLIRPVSKNHFLHSTPQCDWPSQPPLHWTRGGVGSRVEKRRWSRMCHYLSPLPLCSSFLISDVSYANDWLFLSPTQGVISFSKVLLMTFNTTNCRLNLTDASSANQQTAVWCASYLKLCTTRLLLCCCVNVKSCLVVFSRAWDSLQREFQCSPFSQL